jgi:CubicO group peptidase (beta-lactamase class C family)
VKLNIFNGILLMGGVCLLAIFVFLMYPFKAKFSLEQWQPLIKDDESLAKALLEISKKYNQPAIGAALIQGENIVAESAVGSAVYGENIPVTINSRFHIGSVTKSMTSLLIAILVDEEILRYDMTLEQALPEIPMLKDYRHMTISDLLLNRAGIIAFQSPDFEDPALFNKLWQEIPAQYSNPTIQREEITKIALGHEPITKPGGKAVYSNVGWAITGLIAEKATHQPYEELLQQKIFKPLGMNTARTGGWPASNMEPNQPRGHYPVGMANNKTLRPQLLNDDYTFPAWMNPAGGVHCSIADFALYVRENLLGLEGKGKLLNTDNYRAIHSIQITTKIKDMYMGAKGNAKLTMGYGWAVIAEEGSLLSVADGSGGTFYARIIVFPALNTALAAFTNCGDGSHALDKVIERLTGFEWNS